MAVRKAIQMRRGPWGDFDESTTLPAEWQIVLGDDPSASDGKSVYIAFGAGDVKRMATWEDLVAWLYDHNPVALNALIDAVIQATDDANDAADRANASADTADATNTAIASAESARVSAEQARVTAEQGRVDAETSRASAEQARVTAEDTRASNESTRSDNEDARVAAESARVSAESGRVSAEDTRVSNENARIAAESARVSAESARVAAESDRSEAQAANNAAQVANNTAQAANNTAQTTNDTAQAANNLDQQRNNEAAASGYARYLVEGEYDPTTGKPTISASTEYRMCISPNPDQSDENNRMLEWARRSDDGETWVWELVGGTGWRPTPATSSQANDIWDGQTVTSSNTPDVSWMSYYATKIREWVADNYVDIDYATSGISVVTYANKATAEASITNDMLPCIVLCLNDMSMWFCTPSTEEDGLDDE